MYKRKTCMTPSKQNRTNVDHRTRERGLFGIKLYEKNTIETHDEHEYTCRVGYRGEIRDVVKTMEVLYLPVGFKFAVTASRDGYNELKIKCFVPLIFQQDVTELLIYRKGQLRPKIARLNITSGRPECTHINATREAHVPCIGNSTHFGLDTDKIRHDGSYRCLVRGHWNSSFFREKNSKHNNITDSDRANANRYRSKR